MIVLVVGSRSMLAQELLPCLQQAGFTVAGRGRPELDITQAASIHTAFAAVQPDICINTAAYTAVDRAESEPAEAFATNRDGVAHLAIACRDAGVPLLHVSTDYVFDGTASRPYQEDDPSAPLGVYGHSKWAGEEALRGLHAEHLIVRTAWLYGHHGSNFVKTMLRLGREREVLSVVQDQHGCPTWTRDLARALTAMCQRLARQRQTCPWGTYHFCGAGRQWGSPSRGSSPSRPRPIPRRPGVRPILSSTAPSSRRRLASRRAHGGRVYAIACRSGHCECL
jgi:dTDP-4-dehydrorhamnose reductase